MAPNSTTMDSTSPATNGRNRDKNTKFVECDEAHDDHNHDHDHDQLKLKFSPKEIFHGLLTIDWTRVNWVNTFGMILLHSVALHGLFLCALGHVKLITPVVAFMICFLSGLGVTMGAHRLWTHKSFNATPLTRFLLMLAQTVTFQESIYTWAIDHRTHHKYTDTDADHTNIRRGFFYAHIGHIMYEIHPDVIKARENLDASDLLEDPIVKYQHKVYYPLALVLAFILPTIMGVTLLGETWYVSFVVLVCMRLCITFHVTFSTGSFSHLIGNKPYDKNILASEHPVIGTMSLGEGWHNYHHVFPNDYRASEFSQFTKNPTTAIIEFCSRFGFTYNLKRASDAMIRSRMGRTGDPSHNTSKAKPRSL